MFNNVLESRILKIREVLSSKGREYASDSDRFYNFHVASRVMGCSPRKALWGMALKHLVSVIDLVDERIPDSYVDEKIGDMVNYLILLEGLILEDGRESVGGRVKDPFP